VCEVPREGFVNRSGHTATLLDNGRRLLVLGGLTEDLDGHYHATAAAVLADLEAGELTMVTCATPFVNRLRHTTCRLPDGRVLVFGGYDLESRMVLHGLQVGELSVDGRTLHWHLQDTTGPGPGPRTARRCDGILPQPLPPALFLRLLEVLPSFLAAHNLPA